MFFFGSRNKMGKENQHLRCSRLLASTVCTGILGRHKREGGGGESFAGSERQTIRRTDALKDWSPILKPHLPFGPSIQPPPPSPILSSPPAILHTPSPHHPEARLWTVHTHTHMRHRRRTLKTTSPAHSGLPSQSLCWRNPPKGGDWRDGLDTTLQRGRSETEDLATLPRHRRYPRWRHRRSQRPSSCDCD